MTAILLRFLPHAIVVAAILGAILWIDHSGYQRARKDVQQERLVTALMLTRAAREMEANLGQRMTEHDAAAARVERVIEQTRTVYQPIITKEIASVPRLSDPDLGITDRMFEAINRARTAGACSAAADGAIVCAVPAAAESVE